MSSVKYSLNQIDRILEQKFVTKILKGVKSENCKLFSEHELTSN